MNSEASNIKCFIIHLQRANKRKKFVEEIVKNVPMVTEIIDAIDGRLLSDKKLTAFYPIKKFMILNIPLK